MAIYFERKNVFISLCVSRGSHQNPQVEPGPPERVIYGLVQHERAKTEMKAILHASFDNWETLLDRKKKS